MPGLHSILDNDFYKFTMQNAVVQLFPGARARYRFINRGDHRFPKGFAERLQMEIQKMSKLRLSKDEKHFFAVTCPYLKPTYLDFLEGYRFDPDEVKVSQHGDQLEVAIEGHWYRAILWEVPIMSLICELYYEMSEQRRAPDSEVIDTAKRKIERYGKIGVTIAEFGTRRRHSYAVQDLVVAALKDHGYTTFVGTSNVHLAMKHRTRPIGTHAHEWFMYHAAQYGYKMADRLGLEHWAEVYRGDLGIALSDTYTSNVFFDQFDKKLSKLFDGVRHDSGDPLEFADRTIEHYRTLGIDPLSKTITFSDGLNYEKVERIAEHCKGRIGFSFGVGTDFTNDVGLPKMNIVLKMTEAQPEGSPWTPVVKLSDEPNKHTGEPDAIRLARTLLQIDETGTN